MSFDFTGKKVLVTGAGGGMGSGLVKGLVGTGAEVFALESNKESLESLVKEVPGVHPLQVDLSDWTVTREAVDKLAAMDGVVNCAGILPSACSSLEASVEELEKVLKVNLLAAINVIQSAGKKMVAAGKGGSIVNIASMNSLNPVKNLISYNVSKAGLDMVSKQFALELGPHNIRVNSVNPSPVLTPMGRAFLETDREQRDRVLALTPMKRLVEVEEAVDLIMFLLSDRSTMISGTTNRLDGGILSHIAI